jgi:stage IV sporulation protein FB
MKPVSLGRISGVPLQADWSFGFILAWLVMSNSGSGGEGFGMGLGFGAMVVVSIVVHELGHALVGRRMGLRPVGILLHSFGGLCRYDRAPSGLQGVIVSAAGPGAGLLLGVLAFVLNLSVGGWLPAWGPWALVNLAIINVFWSLFNLLPMLPLDGGHVVFHALEARWKPRQAMRSVAIVSLVTAGLVGAWAFWASQTFILIVVALVVMQNLPKVRR